MLIIAQKITKQKPGDKEPPFPFEEAFTGQEQSTAMPAAPVAPAVQETQFAPEPSAPAPAPEAPAPELATPEKMAPVTPAITAPVDGTQEPMAPAPGRLPSMVGEPQQEKMEAPGPGVPEDPAKLFEEVLPPDTPMQEKNRIMDVRQKVAFSLGNGTPLKITYTTLPKPDNAAGSTTQRVITPDYVYWAGTGRHVVVAWDDSKNDWRAFALERINGADLLDEAA